jgi:tryptophan synthase beta subunit
VATPDIANRHFGQFGGQYIPETLVEAHRELEVVRATPQPIHDPSRVA